MTSTRKHIIIDSIITLCILLVGVITLVLRGDPHPTPPRHSSSANSAHKTKDSSSVAAADGATPQTSTTQNQQSPTPSVPNNPACKLLTLAIARQILGDSAQYTTPSDPAISQPSGTSLSSCAYSSGTAGIQMVIRTAKSSLGASQNATVFGSEKPSGVTNVEGYGQSAYWNPQTTQLHILSSNNWYIITTSQSSQAGAEAVAQLIVGGF